MKQFTNCLLAGLFCVASLMSCDALTGKEIARATFTNVSTPEKLEYKSTLIKLEKGEKIWFWTEMNLEYDGSLKLEFLVQFAKTMGLPSIRLNPLQKDISINETKMVVGNHVSWSFSGRIGSFEAPVAANYDMGTLLLSSDNPTLKLKKAVLVFKK